MAAFMLPLASRGAPSVPALLQSIDAVAADGWGLLHKAVLSGDILMAQVCGRACSDVYRGLSYAGRKGFPPLLVIALHRHTYMP